MNKKYPNLELVAHKSKQIIHTLPLSSDSDASDKFNFNIQVFKQTFPNTAGLQAAPRVMCGQAFTDYYSTVVHEPHRDIFLIFSGDVFVYGMWGEFDHDRLEQDIQGRCLAALGDYKKRYKATNTIDISNIE